MDVLRSWWEKKSSYSVSLETRCRSSQCLLELLFLWSVGVNHRLISSEHPLSRACRRSQQSGLRAIDSGHVLQDCFVALVFRDEDRIRHDLECLPRSSECLLVSSWIVPSVPSMTGRVRSPYASILELEYAFVDAGGQLPCGGVEEEARPSAYGSQCTFADAPSSSTRSCRRSLCAVCLAAAAKTKFRLLYRVSPSAELRHLIVGANWVRGRGCPVT